MKRIFYVLIVALLTVACEDEDKFSTGAGMRLDFEVDTLKLDTVFSNTPSSTYKFWVYNRQDNGLRLQTVRLKKGNPKERQSVGVRGTDGAEHPSVGSETGGG